MPMRDPVDRAVRAISRRNSYALIWAQFGLSHVVMLGGIALLTLYQKVSEDQFWVLVVISQLLVSVDNVISIKLTRRMWRPVWAWERGQCSYPAAERAGPVKDHRLAR